jgi:hypothetical protein
MCMYMHNEMCMYMHISPLSDVGRMAQLHVHHLPKM